MKIGKEIPQAEGKLGILIPGMGAVTTTLIAGVEMVRRGLGKPIGSLTEMGNIKLGKGDKKRTVAIKDFVPISSLDDIVFGGWDIFDETCYETAVRAGVLRSETIEPVKDYLSGIKPMKAVFDRNYVRRLNGPNIKEGKNKKHLAEQLIEDIERFKSENSISRLVMIWIGSTETFQQASEVHQDLKSFEAGLEQSDPGISPSQIYAYAALKLGIPFANGAPNLTTDIPAMLELAEMNGVPLAGKDFKTGQTLIKTIIAPGLKARLIGLGGWFSTNILGNRDGEVLDDPRAFKSKEETKLSVLDSILEPDLYPDLYKDFYHKIRINYYPPRGDDKEGWDNIDIFGWLNYNMQVKIDFLCKDSILAAPLALDLVRFLDLAKRAGMSGVQDWLSFYFKSPIFKPGETSENDLFIQRIALNNTLRYLMGEEPLTHVDFD